MRTLTILIALLIFGYSSYSQKNILSKETVISVSGVNFEDIKNTKGNENKMRELFGGNLNVKKSDEPVKRISYWNNKFNCSFELDNFPNLVSLRVKENCDFQINKKIVRIGESIETLGNIKSFEPKNNQNKKLAVFIPLDGLCDCSFAIEFDKNTKAILKIEYYSW